MRTMRLILVTTAILLATSLSYGRSVNDNGSPNFLPSTMFPIYGYIDIKWVPVSSQLEPGTEAISGGYLEVFAMIQTGGYLTDFNKVINITATHSPSGRTYPLTASRCRDWEFPNRWVWSISL